MILFQNITKRCNLCREIFVSMETSVTSTLSTISPSMASISSTLSTISSSMACILPPQVQICLAWNPKANTDVGWLTFLNKGYYNGPSTLATTHLGFRDWNVQAGITANQGPVAGLLRDVLDLLTDKTPWRVQLAWDNIENEDVGWICTHRSFPSHVSLGQLQLRRWNLCTVRTAPAISTNVTVLTNTTITTNPAIPTISAITTIPPITTIPTIPSTTTIPTISKPLLSLPPGPTVPSLHHQPGTDQVECGFCHKFMQRRSLRAHMKQFHPNNEFQESLVSAPSSSKIISRPTTEKSQSSYIKTSTSPDLLVLSDLPQSEAPQSPSAIFQIKQEPVDDEFFTDKCNIVYEFGGRKLKLKSHSRRPMSKSLTVFAQHRKLSISDLVFRLKDSGEKVDPSKPAGDYGGAMVIVTMK